MPKPRVSRLDGECTEGENFVGNNPSSAGDQWRLMGNNLRMNGEMIELVVETLQFQLTIINSQPSLS